MFEVSSRLTTKHQMNQFFSFGLYKLDKDGMNTENWLEGNKGFQ